MAKRERDSGFDLSGTPLGDLVAGARPYVLPLLGLTFALLVTILVFNRVERFLLDDARFVMRTPELGVKLSPDLRVRGLERAQLQQVRGIFRGDEGQSVFRIGLEDRRKRLQEIRWVRKASVSRVWPNVIDVRLEERVPVAFVQVSSYRRDQPARVSLIDEDGVLLPVTPGVDYAVPVLTGVREDRPLVERAARVRLMRRFLTELGDLSKPVSEVNVCREDNLRVVYPMNGRAITLVMGGELWRPRLLRFLKHYPEIEKKMPEVVRLDLRLEDRITADQHERQECDGE